MRDRIHVQTKPTMPDDQVQEALRLSDEGKTNKEIAEKFGVKPDKIALNLKIARTSAKPGYFCVNEYLQGLSTI